MSEMMMSHSDVCVRTCVCSVHVCVIMAGVKEVRVGRTNMCPNNCDIDLFLISRRMLGGRSERGVGQCRPPEAGSCSP